MCHRGYESRRLIHIHVHVPESASHLPHEPVGGIIVQFVKHVSLNGIVLEHQPHRCQPLPVAIMSYENRHRFSLSREIVYKVDIHEFHVAHHLLGGNRQELEALKNHVDKGVVETLLYGYNLGMTLFGERLHKVLAHHAATIAHHVIERKIDNI